MRKPYIFFDFDGTLMNTNDIIIASWNHTAKHYLGHELDTDEILRTFGETIRYTVQHFFPGVDVDEAVNCYRAYQEENYVGSINLFDGVREMLDELIAKGYKLAIVTSRTRNTSMDYIDLLGIRDLFEVFITCDDTPVHKPEPKPLDMAIEQMEEKLRKTISKDECIMIGDTKFDIGCGNNAGVDTVLVDWSHPIDESAITELGFKADYRISTPIELLDIV